MEIDNELLDEWKDFADGDLKTAKLLLTNNNFLHGVFHLQQALEKYLKRYFIITKKEQPPYIHNLTELANRAELLNVLTETQKDLLENLTPYYIKTRYPSYKKKMSITLNPKRANQLLKAAEEFIIWLESQKK